MERVKTKRGDLDSTPIVVFGADEERVKTDMDSLAGKQVRGIESDADSDKNI